jgi:hypothetical protein
MRVVLPKPIHRCLGQLGAPSECIIARRVSREDSCMVTLDALRRSRDH